MNSRIDNFIIREADGVRTANSLVLGRGFGITRTAGGLPELTGLAGEALLMPSGGDDTAAIRAALDGTSGVRLGPGGFTVTGTITLAEGQRVTGAGPEHTYVLPDHPDAVFSLANKTALESLSIIGPNTPSPGSVGVVSSIAEDVRLHRLRVDTIHQGIQLGGARRVEISQVSVYSTQAGAVSVSGGEQVVITGLAVDGSGGAGLALSSLDSMNVLGATLRNCQTGLSLFSGSDHSIQGIRIATCTHGVTLNTLGSLEMSGVQVAECGTGYLCQGVSEMTIDGCSVLYGRQSPLVLTNCKNVTVSGFLCDLTQSLGLPSTPHVKVDGGSTLVVFTSIRRFNAAIPPTIEVDVAGAGGRVLFLQHDFDPARINSGGNFAAL